MYVYEGQRHLTRRHHHLRHPATVGKHGCEIVGRMLHGCCCLSCYVWIWLFAKNHWFLFLSVVAGVAFCQAFP
jgi:hypothetical protein